MQRYSPLSGLVLAVSLAVGGVMHSPVSSAAAPVQQTQVTPATQPTAALAANATTRASGVATRVASFNIRCLCTEANPVNVWDSGNRKLRAATQIRQSGAQIVGLQETYARQVTDLFGNGSPGLLGAGWAQTSAGAPEAMNAVGWNTAYFTKVDAGFRYLTTGPAALDGSSRAYERTVNWVKLRSRVNGQEFYVFNTHLEHRGTTTVSVTGQTYGQIRDLQTSESLAAIRAVNSANLPTILTGDFNADQRQRPFSIVQNSGLVHDSLTVAQQRIDSTLATFNGWQPARTGNRIDFAFVSRGITVNRYEVYDTLVNGLYASDHFPVLVDLTLPTPAAPSNPVGGSTTKVFSVPTSTTLYGVTGTGTTTRAVPLSFAQWAALGYPTPLKAPAAFVKYAWSDDLYMVNFWDAAPQSWTWTRLGFAEWSKAGYPKPYLAGWIEGTTLVKYGTGDQIFATLGTKTKALTFAEWQATGFKPYTNRSSAGFVKTPTSSTIYRVDNLSRMQGIPLTWQQWASYGFPPPMTVARVY